jgi:2-oxoisovalerate dehydrogenase E1 component
MTVKKKTKLSKTKEKTVKKNIKGKVKSKVKKNKTKSKVKTKAKTTPKKQTAKITSKSKSKSKIAVRKSKSKLIKKTTQKSLPKKDEAIEIYKKVKLARLIDEKIIVLYKQNKCHFQIGCSGHELPGVIAGKVFRASKDWFYPYYRDLALCLSLGMTPLELFLNALNKEGDPSSHGRQMPAHFGHKDLNIVSQSSPTGSQFLQAVGAALAIKKLGKSEVVYVSAGEGTCAQGDFHEALNWATRDKLPIVFLIQNNGYAISVPVSEQLAGESVYKLVQGYEGLKTYQLNGSNLKDCNNIIKEAYNHALNQKGAVLIEASVPRLQSHSISDNHKKYREEEDILNELKRCPLLTLEAELIKQKVLTASEIKKINSELKKIVDKCAEEAERSPDPSTESAIEFNYAESSNSTLEEESFPENAEASEETYLVDAINHGLSEELEFNNDLYIFGQDVAGGKGGVFSVTAGLTEKFGKERVFNSQLAESSIVGVAIGMASRGLKPVVEIQFGDYIWTAMNQIRNELAMMHYRSAGDFECPVVIRVAVGGYIRGACYHSQNIEGTFAHFPGLHIVYPSNARDAKGLLKSAIRSRNPVLFLEHKGLYRQVYAKGVEGSKDQFTPLGKAKIVKTGDDLTIITYGAMVQKSLLVAKELEKNGSSIEVVDLRSIVPFDAKTVFESVKKTNRVLIAYEDVEFMGFGSEISAQIVEKCFEFLDAPISRVAMKNVSAVPHAPKLEEEILPQVWDVLEKAREVLAY